MSGVQIHLEGRRVLGNRGLRRSKSQCAGGLEEPAAPGVSYTLRQVKVGKEKVCEAGTGRARCPGQEGLRALAELGACVPCKESATDPSQPCGAAWGHEPLLPGFCYLVFEIFVLWFCLF